MCISVVSPTSIRSFGEATRTYVLLGIFLSPWQLNQDQAKHRFSIHAYWPDLVFRADCGHDLHVWFSEALCPLSPLFWCYLCQVLCKGCQHPDWLHPHSTRMKSLCTSCFMIRRNWWPSVKLRILIFPRVLISDSSASHLYTLHFLNNFVLLKEMKSITCPT